MKNMFKTQLDDHSRLLELRLNKAVNSFVLDMNTIACNEIDEYQGCDHG